MEKRMNFGKVEPAAYTAMGALDAYNEKTSLEKLERELIKIRASQINGCGYCLNQHSLDARKAGASEQWVFLIGAWREAGKVFTDEEKLLLQMTEEITLISQHGLSDAAYSQSIAVFGEQKTAQIIMAIVTINAWNRLGVSAHLHPKKH